MKVGSSDQNYREIRQGRYIWYHCCPVRKSSDKKFCVHQSKTSLSLCTLILYLNFSRDHIACILLLVVFIFFISSCATLLNDAMVPVSFSFSDGSEGACRLENKRGLWQAELPSTVYVRRSDDSLKYDCDTEDGRNAIGAVPSTMGAEIVASAIFWDLGITDAITDKHRNYPASVVVPIKKNDSGK